LVSFNRDDSTFGYSETLLNKAQDLSRLTPAHDQVSQYSVGTLFWTNCLATSWLGASITQKMQGATISVVNVPNGSAKGLNIDVLHGIVVNHECHCGADEGTSIREGTEFHPFHVASELGVRLLSPSRACASNGPSLAI